MTTWGVPEAEGGDGRSSGLGQSQEPFLCLLPHPARVCPHKATSHGFQGFYLAPTSGELILMESSPFQCAILKLGNREGDPLTPAGTRAEGIFIASLDIITREYNFMNFLIC